ncbi:putative regulatory protein, FmdB family [Thermanaeromonas toyohensis ToBE]|uniref:Putative regulatory protein, FmdB family n=2 Tax=Thermanaeromonas TaxID=202949 RepID=A0A1W1W212_9FIRM|nr:putative regulatory protein, FmdB family [Thermanaeromonas toyohensis ToBE]
MPEFEYKCNDCGALSVFYKREEAQSCPVCGSSKLVRIFSPPDIIKGNIRTNPDSKGLCCGRDSRPDDCVPGSCCRS